MTGSYLFIAHGDLTRLRADAIVYSTSIYQQKSGDLYQGLCRIPGFDAAYAEVDHALGAQGDAVWIDCGRGSENRHCYGVTAVATRGAGKVTAADVRRATTSALECAAAALAKTDRALMDDWPKRLVAMPSLGTGSGEASESAWVLAEAQVTAVADFQRRHSEIDVVIVAFRRSSCDRLWQAREAHGAWTRVRPLSAAAPWWKTLAASIRDGTCIPFLGAGMSKPSALPDWRGFLEELERAVGVAPGDHEGLSYTERAERCVALAEEGGGGRPHWEVIHQRFGRAADRDRCVPNLAHYLVAHFSTPFVATTNYDPLIEQTLDAVRRPANVVVEDLEVAESGGRSGTSVLKLHGCAGVLGARAGQARGVVLTKSEYAAYKRDSPAKVALLRGLLLNHHFLFLGYGLGDENLNKIIAQVSDLLGATQRDAYLAYVGDEPATAKKHEHLHVIEFEGRSFEERARSMWIWLDELATRTVGRKAILAQGVAEEGPLADLRAELAAAARKAEELYDHAWTPEEVAWVAPVYAALEALGHTPTRVFDGAEKRLRWWRIWKHLADRARGPEKRRLLLRALASGARPDEEHKLREELS